MRRIYIVTYYKSANYGSRLQALALYRYLESRGYEPIMLDDFKVVESFIKHPRMLFGRAYNKLHTRRRRKFFRPSAYEISPERQARLDAFLKDNFKEQSFRKTGDWKRVVNEGAAFVVGSDIVWQPMQGYPSKFFLDFALVEGLQCFSYAPSIGAKTLPKEYANAYKAYLGAYRCIGVRETAAVRLLEPIIEKSVIKNVDPTLLLPPEKWNPLAQRAAIPEFLRDKRFAFCYFVMDDPRYWRYVAQAQQATGLEMVVLPMHYADENQPYTILAEGTPYEFVWLVKNADMVITDSYHASLFSMQYETDFYLLRRTREDEDDKYNDFLKRYKLEDRVVADVEMFEVKPATDYRFAKGQLESDRIDSMAFLEVALQGI